MMNIKEFSLAFLLSSIVAMPVSAQGLLATCPANNPNCSDTQRVFPTYTDTNVRYRLDRDLNFGDVQNHKTSFDEVLDIWDQVPTSKINFINDGDLDEDIDETNFAPILNTNQLLGFTPVVFDSDGEIFEDLLGQGTKEFVLGFAGPRVSSPGNFIPESQAAFNGFLYTINETGSQNATNNLFQTTVLHEMGHAINLDHTQIFIDNFNNFNNLDRIPVMFPIAANPEVVLRKDDIVAVSAPENYRTGNFNTAFGTINGQILNNFGLQVRGANIIAFNVADIENAVSSTSNADANGNGFFEIPGLDPGDYILQIEPIDQEFTGGSSVGPDGPPFNPNNVFAGFFNGDGEDLLDISLNNAVNQATRISVSAQETITINFNGSTATVLDGDIGDDDQQNDDDDQNNDDDQNDDDQNNDDDNQDNDDQNDDQGDLAEIVEFRGKAIDNGVLLKFGKTKKVKLKVKKFVKGESLNLRLETDLPNLVTLNKDTLSFGNSKKAKAIKLTLASFEDFLLAFPELEEGEPVELVVRAIDDNDNEIETVLFLF